MGGRLLSAQQVLWVCPRCCTSHSSLHRSSSLFQCTFQRHQLLLPQPRGSLPHQGSGPCPAPPPPTLQVSPGQHAALGIPTRCRSDVCGPAAVQKALNAALLGGEQTAPRGRYNLLRFHSVSTAQPGAGSRHGALHEQHSACNAEQHRALTARCLLQDSSSRVFGAAALCLLCSAPSPTPSLPAAGRGHPLLALRPPPGCAGLVPAATPGKGQYEGSNVRASALELQPRHCCTALTRSAAPTEPRHPRSTRKPGGAPRPLQAHTSELISV